MVFNVLADMLRGGSMYKVEVRPLLKFSRPDSPADRPYMECIARLLGLVIFSKLNPIPEPYLHCKNSWAAWAHRQVQNTIRDEADKYRGLFRVVQCHVDLLRNGRQIAKVDGLTGRILS